MATLPPISPEVFKAYKSEIAKNTSPATVKRKEVSLNRFFDWASTEGHIPANSSPGREGVSAFVISPKKGKVSTRVWAVAGITGSMVVLIFLLLYQLKFPIPFIKSFAQESKIQTPLNQNLTGQALPQNSSASGSIPANNAVIGSWNLFAKLKLTDSEGSPRVGSETLSFKLFDSPTEGKELYSSSAQSVTTDKDGSALISLSDVPSNLFFENNSLYLEPQMSSGSATARIPVSTANTSANLGGFFPANPDAGAGNLTVPVIDSTGSLLLASESPAIKAKEGNLLIEGQTVTVKTTDGGGGNIEFNPDANGYAHFLFEGNKGNFLNAQGPNLTTGSLYYGMVPNNATGYDLIRLQSGAPKMKTRFSVDALGNTYIAGNENVIGNISTNSVVRLTSGGALQNITGYSQNSGNFTITQNPGDFASINKTITSGGALSDILTLTLDERGKPATSNSDYSTLVLNRYDGNGAAAALKVNTGNAIFNGQTELGRFSVLPGAIGQGSLVFNTSDSKVYVWDGVSWVAVGSGSASFDAITSGTNTTAAMIVGSGASLSFSGTGTITASDVTCVGCVSNSELVSSTITFAGNSGSTAIALGGTENIVGGTTITTTQSGSTLTADVADDSLDFAQLKDAMTLDASTDIALGAFTLSTSGTGALNFASTGQVNFAGNVDATGGLDVTGSLTQNTFGVCDSSGANCPFSGGYWNEALGALFPTSSSVDLLVGSSATASAKFAFINVASGTPTASIAGSIADVATYLTGNGSLSTTNAQDLTLGSATTGNVVINSRGSTALTANAANLTAAGNLTIAGTTGLTFSGAGGDITFTNGEKIDNDTNGTVNISTAILKLTGGTSMVTDQTSFDLFNTTTTTLNIGGDATVVSVGDATGTTTINNALAVTLATNLNGDTTIGNAITDNITFTGRVALDSDLIPIGTTGTNDLGSSLLPWDNIYGVALFQGAFAVCDSSGANCPFSGGYWAQALGALYPTNNSVDVLIGSDATTSAKFAFYNVLTGTPTASIAGSITNVATYLTGDGSLSTTNAQGLTLGSATTGNVVINSRGSTALTADAANLTAAGNLTIQGTTGLTFNTGAGGDITFANGEKIDNDTDGTINIATTILKLTGGTSEVTDQTTFALFDTTTTTLSLGGAATTLLNLGNGTGTYTAINLGSGIGTHVINIAGTGATAADTINIGTGGTGADTINIGSSATTTAINLTSGTGPQTHLSSVATGTGLTGAFVFKDTALSSGDLIYATASAITSGNIVKIGQGGDTNFTGNVIYGDIDNTGQGGIGFTGNFLKFDNATLNKYFLDSAGNSSQSGTLTFGGTATIQSTATRALTLGGATTGNITLSPLNDVAGGFVAPNVTNVSDLGLASKIWRNIYGTSIFQGIYQVCDSSGANCPAGAGFWAQALGALYPTSSTVDLLVGASSTTSAKFAFYNVLTGLPTASIAGDVANVATYLTGNGNLATTNFRNLTLGGSTTGNIVVNPSNSIAGGNISPAATDVTDLGTSSSLEFRNIYGQFLFQSGNAVCDSSGANCPASGGFWDQALGALYPINNSVDLLIGASSTTSAKFAFYNVLTGLPTASIAGDVANVATFLTGDGNLSTTNAQDLTLGGTFTGNVIINSRGSTALTANGANLTAAGDLSVNGGDLTTNQTTFNLINGTATTLNLGGAATTFNIAPAGASGLIALSGGSGDTGCTLDGTTGNFTCSGTISGSAASTKWNGITNPDGDLSLTMTTWNTTFNWDPGADSAETNFLLTTQGEDTIAGGEVDQILLALSQTSNGVDVDQAADALLTLANNDANDPVTNGIRFDAGAGGVDFTYGINFDAASISSAEIVLQNAETIDNVTDGTVLITSPLTKTSSNLEIAGTTGLTFSGVGGDITFTNGEKIDNDVNGTVNITTTILKLTGGTSEITDQTTFDLFNTTTTTLNIGGAATTALNIGNGASAYAGINIGSGNGGNILNLATGTGADTVNIATGATSADTVNIGATGVATLVNVNSGATTQNIITESGTSLTSGNFIVMNSDANRTALAISNSDATIAGQKDQKQISSITNTFVYDTTQDSDGGLWKNDERAKSSSWYNETIDNIASSCITDTDDRCGRREFPDKAILVATTTKLYIYDTKDNTLWMDFRKGSGSTEQMIGPTTDSTGSTVFALNGKIYYGNNGSVGGLYVIDLKGDRAQRYNASDDFVGDKNIGSRNSTVTWSAGPLSPIANTIVEDIRGIVYGGKTYISVANNAGVSVINETDRNVYSYSDVTSDVYKSTFIDKIGDLYMLNSTSKQLERWNNVVADSASELNGTPDFVWDETTVPALFTTAQTVNTAPDALFVTTGTSDVDGKSDTIYVGTATSDAAGDLTVINDKKGDETKGSVKYYTNSYITEEMIGDIRGMWPLDSNFGSGLSDASVKAQTLTNNGVTTFSTSAVRGFGGSFNGATQYLSKTDNANLSITGSVSFGTWFKTTSASTNQFIISKNGSYTLEITAGGKVQGIITGGTTGTRPSANSIDTGWHHAVVVYDAGAQTLNIYLDGILNNGSLGGTVPVSITDSANDFNIGADAGATFFGGTIDEPFVTAGVLTASEVRHIFEVGYRALQNHTASRITGVTGVDNYQRLMGNASGGTSTTNRVFAVGVDDANQFIYAGLNDSSGNTGGVTAIGIDSDTALDLYDGTANTTKKTDANTQYSANDIISLSVSGFPCVGYNSGTTACDKKATLSLAGIDGSGDAQDWMETTNTSLYSTLATLTSPNSVKNAVTVNNMFQVFNTYNNLSQSSSGENIQTPAFSVDSSGNLTYNYLGTNTAAVGAGFNDSSLVTGDLMRLTESNAAHTGSALDIVYGGADAGFGFRVNDDGTITDSTPFVVTGTGKVGIGKTAPLFNLDVAGNASISATLSLAPTLLGDAGTCNAASAGKEYYDGPVNLYYFCNGTAWTQFATGSSSPWTFDTTNGVIYPISNSADILIGASATTSAKFAFKNILTGTPTLDVSAQATNIAVKDNTTNALQVLEGANAYLSLNTNNTTESLNFGNATTNPSYTFLGTGGVNLNGNALLSPADLTITPSGGQLILADTATLNVGGKVNVGYNVFGNAADAPAITTAISTDNDLFIGGDLELKGGLYLTGKNIFNVVGSVATGTISFASDPSLIDNYNTLGNGSWVVNNDANAGIAALMVNQGAQNTTADLFVASASGVNKFRITNVGDVLLGDNSGTDLTVGGGTGKIDVGTVDPPYTINGKKFATFLAGMVGVKEETAGLINTNEYVPGTGYRSVIDFNNLPEGSDLWLFGKSTNIKENIDKLVALLTPSSPTRVWYDVDRTNKKLVIYSARPTEISYRLTGPRFDYQSFPNYRDQSSTTIGFVINSIDTLNNSLVVADVQQLASYVTQKVSDGFYILKDSSGTIIDGVESVGNFVAGNIKAGMVDSQLLIADSFRAAQATINNLTINNQLFAPLLATKLISPIPGGDLAVALPHDSRFLIQDSSSKEVASIDAQGNATFSGIVRSQNIDQIQTMLNQVSADQSVLLAATSGANLTATGSANLSQLIASDLYVTGHAAISSLLVNDNFTVNIINSLSGPLQIQSLALAPVEIMNGLVSIDTHGNVNIAGDLNVAGKITTPQLDAGILNTGDLIIGAPDATVSGVVSNGEITTNSTVGKAVIPAGISEITIKNPKITDYTLVYVTPTSDTANNVLYIKSKQAEQFTVGFTNPINLDATFNWWIVQVTE